MREQTEIMCVMTKDAVEANVRPKGLVKNNAFEVFRSPAHFNTQMNIDSEIGCNGLRERSRCIEAVIVFKEVGTMYPSACSAPYN